MIKLHNIKAWFGEIKLCQDCRHLETERVRCMRPYEKSLVTGKIHPADYYAEYERSGEGRSFCGPRAKFWEAKEND